MFVYATAKVDVFFFSSIKLFKFGKRFVFFVEVFEFFNIQKSNARPECARAIDSTCAVGTDRFDTHMLSGLSFAVESSSFIIINHNSGENGSVTINKRLDRVSIVINTMSPLRHLI